MESVIWTPDWSVKGTVILCDFACGETCETSVFTGVVVCVKIV